MGYPVKLRFGGKETSGNFELVALIEKIETMVKKHGTGKKEEKR